MLNGDRWEGKWRLRCSRSIYRDRHSKSALRSGYQLGWLKGPEAIFPVNARTVWQPELKAIAYCCCTRCIRISPKRAAEAAPARHHHQILKRGAHPCSANQTSRIRCVSVNNTQNATHCHQNALKRMPHFELRTNGYRISPQAPRG